MMAREDIPKTFPDEPPEPVSEGKAYAWAAGGTLIPLISGLTISSNAHHFKSSLGNRLMGLGFAFGPSLGELYAGAWGYGLFGMGLRGAALLWLSTTMNNGNSDGAVTQPGVVGYDNSALGDALTASLIVGVATIYSFVETRYAVKRANKRIAAQRFGFSPEIFPSSGGALNPGLLAWIKF